MSVPNPKVTMFFVQGTVGWDESHFYTSVVPLTDIALQSAINALMAARVTCLDGKRAQLVDVRTSLDNINRDTVHVARSAIPLPNANGKYASGPDPSSVANWAYQSPQVAWPILFDTSSAVVDSIVYITGMPASTTQTGPGPYDDPSPPVVGTYLAGYAAYLTGGQWGAHNKRAWPATTITPLNSTACTAPPAWAAPFGAQPPTLTFTVAGWPGGSVLAPGTAIRLGGLSWQTHYGRQRYNGTYIVQSSTLTTAICFVPRIKINPLFQNAGYLQVATEGVANYTEFSLRNLTHHKRGRPTYSPRGRVSTAR